MQRYKLIFGIALATGLLLSFSLPASATVGTPVLKSPDNNTLTDDNSPTFKWNGGDNADNFRLVIDDDQDWSNENVFEENYDNETFENEIGVELSDDNYWWKVGAENYTSGDIYWSDNVFTFEVDTTPPTVSGITVSSITEDSAQISWDTSEPTSATVNYGTDDGYGHSESVSGWVNSGSVTLSGLSEGTTYHFQIEVDDEAGNSSSSGDENFATLALPTSSVDSLDNYYWRTTDNIGITASANDEDGTVENVTLQYRFMENSSTGWSSWENFATDDNESDNWSWIFTAPENDGHYEFRSKAIDDDGLSESISGADENVGFDTTLPFISSLQINNGDEITTQPLVTVTFNAQDKTSGLDQMRYKIDDQNWESWKTLENEFNHTFLPPEGERAIHLQVKDIAGLTSLTETDTISLENATFTKPTGSIGDNENKCVDFSDWGLLIENVTLCASEGTSNLEIEVRVDEEKPAEIEIEKPGPMWKYFRLSTNVSDEGFNQMVIRYDIEKSWLEENEINPDDMGLWKLDKSENKWEQVETKIIGENNTHVHYEANVQDLSWFAVAQKTGLGLIWWIIIGIAIAGGAIAFYLLVWPELEPRLGSLGGGSGSGGLR